MASLADLIGDRTIRLITPYGEGALLLERMVGTETLGRGFEYHLDVIGASDSLDLSKLLGQGVTVSLELAVGGFRFWNGVAVEASFAGRAGRHARYRVTLAPWLALLRNTGTSRIFQNMTVPDIIKKVFRDHGISDFTELLSGTYPQREFLVQYRESDFNFVSRLMEREGIYYYFKHAAAKHTLVLADSYGAHEPLPDEASIPYQEDTAARLDRERVESWSVARRVTTGAYASTDFDFERPKPSRLRVTLKQPKKNARGDFELYDQPGEYLETGEGESYVRTRLEELQSDFEIADGQCDVRSMATGALFKLKGHPRADQNKEHLVISATSHVENNLAESGGGAGGGAPVFTCSFRAIDAHVSYRSRSTTPRPFVHGPQTAIVVGKAGEEIWTDKYGRVKVQFHWDREGKNDENSSCWVRVAQVWAGKSWGGMHIPRIGQEVVVDFIEGDPDRPLVTGRVYNADNMPPYDLPANQTQSGIKSRSTKGGTPANFNELRFEDKKGEEQIFFHAEKNMQIEVENDEVHDVGHDRTEHVGHDRTEHVGNDESITIDGNRTETVAKNETITINGARAETVAKDESITINGNRTETVAKNESITISGARTENVSKDESITIGGARTESVGKNESVTVAGARTVSISKDESVTVGGGRTTSVAKNEALSVDQKMVITVSDELTINVGQATLVMKKDGTIALKGKDVSVDGSGKIAVKASGDVTIKGSKIAQN